MNIAYLWVALGGALGSVLRFWVNELVLQRTGSSFPLGILIINVTGSFLIGVFAAFTDPDGRILASPSVRQFLMIGICVATPRSPPSAWKHSSGCRTATGSTPAPTLSCPSCFVWWRSGLVICSGPCSIR